MAPGVRIMSTVNWSDGTQYYSYSGTSMACPMVSAEAALLYAADPDITPSEVYSFITGTASHASAKDEYTGYGIVNYSAAVRAALAAGSSSAGSDGSDKVTTVAKVSGYSGEGSGRQQSKSIVEQRHRRGEISDRQKEERRKLLGDDRRLIVKIEDIYKTEEGQVLLFQSTRGQNSRRQYVLRQLVNGEKNKSKVMMTLKKAAAAAF